MQEEGGALDDGQAQAQAVGLVARGGGLADLEELLEDGIALLGGDADAAVPDLELDLGAAQAAADEHAPAGRVAHGVGDQVDEDAAQHGGVGVHPQARAADVQLQALLGGELVEVLVEVFEQALSAGGLALDLHGVGVQAGDVQQHVEQLAQAVQGGLHAPADVGQVGGGHAVGLGHGAQGGEEEAQGVDGLAQVVAGGGQEDGLGAVGGLGLVFLGAKAFDEFVDAGLGFAAVADVAHDGHAQLFAVAQHGAPDDLHGDAGAVQVEDLALVGGVGAGGDDSSGARAVLGRHQIHGRAPQQFVHRCAKHAAGRRVHVRDQTVAVKQHSLCTRLHEA